MKIVSVVEGKTQSGARLRELLEAARQQIREGEGIAHEDFWREMEQEEKPQKARGGRRKTS